MIQSSFVHVARPRRLRFYLSAAAAILLWHLLRQSGAPPATFVALALFLAAMAALALNSDVAGMEIRDGTWTLFAGRRRWTVALGEVGTVRFLGTPRHPRGLWLSLRDGRTLSLPAALVPDRTTLERALAWRGIPLEA